MLARAPSVRTTLPLTIISLAASTCKSCAAISSALARTFAAATAIAAAKVRAKALDMAAQLLQVDAARLIIVKGSVVRTDGARASISLGDLAHHLRPGST